MESFSFVSHSDHIKEKKKEGDREAEIGVVSSSSLRAVGQWRDLFDDSTYCSLSRRICHHNLHDHHTPRKVEYIHRSLTCRSILRVRRCDRLEQKR